MLRIQATLTGLLLAVVVTGLVAGAAEAVTIDRSDLYLFNDCTAGCTLSTRTQTSVQTTAADEAVPPTPLASLTGLTKLDDTGLPTTLNDPNSDYFLRIIASDVMFPSGTISDTNAATATIRFDVGWYGTVQGAAPPPLAPNAEFLFLLTAMRQGAFGPTDPPVDAGYFRGSSTAIDGFFPGAMEEIYSDCTGMSPSCFVMDINAAQPPDDPEKERYLGFRGELLAPDDPTCGLSKDCTEGELNFVSFSIDWALMQDPLSDEPFSLVNSGYVWTKVPEPSLALLLVAGALALARRRRL